MKMVLIIVSIMMVTTLPAATVKMNFSYFVGIHKDHSRTFINTTSDGKFKIFTSAGNEIIEAKVISDERRTDGELHLDLGQERTLIVTTALSSDAKVRYFLRTREEEIELSPVVGLHIQERNEK